MKKTLAIILVAVMLLSTLVALVVPAAAEGEGEWDAMLQAPYSEWEDREKVPPVPGYYYDETGFHTVSPDYTNFNPEFSVVGKELYDITNFSMTIVVYDYCTEGDNWLSFSVWSDPNGFAQGATTGEWGDGWTSLIRAKGDGKLNQFESWNQTIGGRQNTQQFVTIDGTQTAPVIFEEIITQDGGRLITFAIEEGVVKINGKPVGTGTDNCIQKRFTEGLAYVGVTIHNTDASGEYQPTISVIDVNGEVPTGSDSRAAESKVREYGPMIDSSTVPYGQPAVWFDATGEATNGDTLPTVASCRADYSEDNMNFLITAENSAFAVQWIVPDDITYQAADFTYMLVLFKNFCTCPLEEGQTPATSCTGAEGGAIRYCAGSVTAPNDECMQPTGLILDVTPRDEEGNPLGEDLYTAVVVKIIHEKYVDRIHSIRIDIAGFNSYSEDGKNTVEIMGAGLFRGAGEVVSYVSDFRELGLDSTPIVTAHNDCAADGCIDLDKDGYCDACWNDMPVEPGCEHVDEDEDNVCDLCGGELGETNSTEPNSSEVSTEENSEPTSENNTQNSTADSATTEEKKGCKSAVSVGALAIVAILGTGLVIKKKED